MLKSIQYESESDDIDSPHGYVTNSNGKKDRKKRRGVIEKRRRDRINGSLSDLKRLIPQAFEKQGTTKLEKAEILQMTVEHLRMLNSKGLTGLGTDPGAMAIDYRGIGFRECVSEIARYLVTVEGMDFNNPIRLRLLGHLEAYNSQRNSNISTDIRGFNWNNSLAYSDGSRLPHSKLGYTFNAPTSNLGTIGATSQTGRIDSGYLAASRLGSNIIGSCDSHVTSTPVTSQSFNNIPPVSQVKGISNCPINYPPMGSQFVTSSTHRPLGFHTY